MDVSRASARVPPLRERRRSARVRLSMAVALVASLVAHAEPAHGRRRTNTSRKSAVVRPATTARPSPVTTAVAPTTTPVGPHLTGAVAANGLRYFAGSVPAAPSVDRIVRILPATGQVTAFLEGPGMAVSSIVEWPTGLRMPVSEAGGRATHLTFDTDGRSYQMNIGAQAATWDTPASPQSVRSFVTADGSTVLSATWMVDARVLALSLFRPDGDRARAESDLLAVARGVRVVDEERFLAAASRTYRGTSDSHIDPSFDPLASTAFAADGVLVGTAMKWAIGVGPSRAGALPGVGGGTCGFATIGAPLLGGAGGCGQPDNPTGVIEWGRTIFGGYVAVLRAEPGARVELRRRSDGALISSGLTVSGRGAESDRRAAIGVAIPDMVADAGRLTLVVFRLDGSERARVPV